MSNTSIPPSNDSTAPCNYNSFSEMEKNPIEAEPEVDLHTWKICPMPNSHALMAVLSVLLYSIAFLFYAQRHKLVLFIMTGLIAIFIVVLYIFGVLSLIYMMHKISQMEKNGHTPKNVEEKWWPAANSSSTNSSNNTTINSSHQSESTRPQLSVIDIKNDEKKLSQSENRPQSRPSARSLQCDRFQSPAKQQSSPKNSTSEAVFPGTAIPLQQSPESNGNSVKKSSADSLPASRNISVLEMKF